MEDAAAPAWLDELSLEPGPPWLGMGTRGLDESAWLLPDEERARDLTWKAELVAARHDEVFAALDTPEVAAASREVLDLVAAATGEQPDRTLHPLDAAGRLVQEDLCLLVERDGSPHLDAASLCFPSYWRLGDKLGHPLAAVHDPVAHYADELSDKVDRFIGRLRPDRPVWRRNWSVHDDPTYFLPDGLPEVGGTSTRMATSHAPNRADPRGSGHQPSAGAAARREPPEGLWLRSERQVLRRLATPGAIVFTIRTQQVPLAVLAQRPDVAHRLAAAIAAWSPELVAYKGGHGALAAVGWLRST